VKEALKGTDVAAIKSATEKLNEAWQAASADMYRAASEATKRPGAGAGEPGPQAETPNAEAGKGGKEEGPIIDAEVVDEKK
jgi:molecular chaperone DnaK